MRILFALISLCPLIAGSEALAEKASSSLFWGVALEGYPVTTEMLQRVERETQLFPQVVVFFLQWPSSPRVKTFPKESLENIWSRGAIPCMTWEPMYYENGQEVMISHERILRGDYDPYLTAFAQEAKTWKKPFVIRFAHEMNLDRYHWGTHKAGYGPKSPEIYRLMFRYMVSLFRGIGASNALWAFCPNAESVPNISYDPTASWNQARHYYPGDDYVDILGMDGYNWGTTRKRDKHGWDSHWKSFRDIFSPLYKELKTLSPRKPLWVFETATVNQGGTKGLWIQEALSALKTWEVQGMIWFQVKKEEDWRINSEGVSPYLSLIRSATSGSQDWIKGFLGKIDRNE